MAAYSNNSQASSSLTDLGDPALFGDDDFSWMNTIPFDNRPAKSFTSCYPNETTLPTLQPQHVTPINNILPIPGPPPPPRPSIYPPLTVWPSYPASNPASQLDKADKELTRAEDKILDYENKVLDLEIKLESLKSQADGRLTNLLAEGESMRNILNGIESPSAQDRVRSQLRSTGK